ncbi:MAG: S-layer homology domain-containing protein [Bacillaceae bacterium]|nr:S-layer homology domain-containing protein [Bacillaceae bacterium]
MYQPKSYRKFVAATLSAAAVTAAVAPAVSADSHSFTDVQEGDAHYEAIMDLSAKGVIQGYEDGSFGVNDPLQRRHAAVLFAKALELDAPENLDDVLAGLEDVTADSLYAEQIAAVVNAEIFKGSAGSFMPSDDLTREQMATVLVKAFGLTDTGEELDINLDNVSPSHKDNVKILAQHGITNQLDDFRPSEAVTRGQFATFLWKAMNVQGEVSYNVEVKDGLTAFQRLVEVELDGVTNPEAYTVTVFGEELEYKAESGLFVGLVDSTDEEAIKAGVVVVAPVTVDYEVTKIDTGLTAFQRLVEVELTVDNPEDYAVTVLGKELDYKADKGVFVGLVDSTNDDEIKAGVEVTQK